MKQKHIDAAREARLWIGQILMPGLTVAAGILSIPEVRQVITAKAEQVKQSINQKLKKKEA